MPVANCPGGVVGVFNPATRSFDCPPPPGPEPPPPGGPDIGFPPCEPGHQGTCAPPGGGRTVPGLGSAGLDPFTQAVLGVTGIGIGGIIGGVVGAGIGQKVTGALISTGGDISAIAGALLPSAAGGLLGTVFEEGGIRPDLLAAEQQKVLGIGGLGGGALTAAPYLQATGRLAGALLRGKRVKIGQLVASETTPILGALLGSIL